MLIGDIVSKFSKQNASMPTESEHRLLEKATESLLLDYGLLEETLGEMLSNMISNNHVTGDYTPGTFFPDREAADSCTENIGTFRINVMQNIANISSNMSDTLSSLQKLKFDVVVNDLYNFSDIFNRCTSFYKTFINDVSSYYQRVNKTKFVDIPKTDVFEVLAEDVLKDLDWLQTDLLKSYQTAHRTKLDLAYMATTTELSGIISRLKLMKSDVKNQFINTWLSLIDDIGVNSGIVYQTALKYLQKFQVYFDTNQQRFLEKAKAMNIWRIPEVAIDDANVVRFRLADDEYWQSWPHYMDIDYFSKNQLENIRTETERVFFYTLNGIIYAIEGNIASFAANIETLLQNDLYQVMDDYKTSSHLDNSFVMWVAVNNSRSRLIHRNLIKIVLIWFHKQSTVGSTKGLWTASRT